MTIAQAIDESGWGQSALAVRDNNLFGIKGTGPAGSDVLPTQEFENGQWVTLSAAFRVYHNVAESIADHSELLATDPSYQHAMADRHLPDAFATDLTGVYATDPQYGSNLIAIMRLYNLYQYDSAAPPPAVQAGTANQAGHRQPGPDGSVRAGYSVRAEWSARAERLALIWWAATARRRFPASSTPTSPGPALPLRPRMSRCSEPRRPPSALGRGLRLAGRRRAPGEAGTCRRSRRSLRPPSSRRRRPR